MSSLLAVVLLELAKVMANGQTKHQLVQVSYLNGGDYFSFSSQLLIVDLCITQLTEQWSHLQQALVAQRFIPVTRAMI